MAAAAAVAHLSVRRSPEHRPSTSSSSFAAHRPSLLRCRAFKQEPDGDRGPSSEPDAPKRRKGPLYKLKAAIQGLAGSRSAAAEVYGGEYQLAVEKAEEIFFSVATQLGRYVITMMSSGVVLGVGFQLSGGDSQMNELIWYSWLPSSEQRAGHTLQQPHPMVFVGGTPSVALFNRTTPSISIIFFLTLF